jgi:hypothetical protein
MVLAFIAAVRRAVRRGLGALWRVLSSDPEDRPWERAAVRIVVPFSFAAAGLVAVLVSYRADRPPAIAFGNHLIFSGELLLLAFYGLLLILVPLVRAIGGGELPIELTTRGARFSEREAEYSVATNQAVTERIGSFESAMADQEAKMKMLTRQTTAGMNDFGDELAAIRDQITSGQ